MTLREYLKAKNLTYAQFADVTGYSKSGVGKWVRGERIPLGPQMTRIVKVTRGKVTWDDFYAAKPAKSKAVSKSAPRAA